MLDLGETEDLQDRRHVVPEAASKALLEPVPATHRVVGRASPCLDRPSFAGFCSSALPSGTQSPFVFSIACRSTGA
jgi:hypothetical protein